MNKKPATNLPKAIFLMGPTASGKTALAIALSKKLPVELVSVDSALIYRGMNIGTAKPTTEELALAPHRLLDIRDPTEVYSVSEFRSDALAEMADITQHGKIPLLVGGTMFYYKALLEGLSPLPIANIKVRQRIKQMVEEKGWEALYHQLCDLDPVAGHRIHPNDSQRISRALEVFFISGKTLTELTETSGERLPYNVFQFAIFPVNRRVIHQRIEQRFHQMLALGFESEVRALFTRGDLHADLPSIRCVNYRQMWLFLSGKIDYNDMVYQTICASKQLAKRQMTWLRHWKDIHWLDSEKLDVAIATLTQVLRARLK